MEKIKTKSGKISHVHGLLICPYYPKQSTYPMQSLWESQYFFLRNSKKNRKIHMEAHTHKKTAKTISKNKTNFLISKHIIKLQ